MTAMMGHDEFTITFHMVNGIMQTFRVTNLPAGSTKEHKDTMADWNSCSYAEAQPCSVATFEAPPCLKTALRTGGIKLSYSLAVELGRPGAWPRAVSLLDRWKPLLNQGTERLMRRVVYPGHLLSDSPLINHPHSFHLSLKHGPGLRERSSAPVCFTQAAC